MLKVYGIYGRTSAIIRVPVGNRGRAFLQCEFSRGRMGVGSADRPATYSTGDTIKQAIIENSPMFGKSIRLIRTYEDKSPTSATDTGQTIEPLGEIADVTSREEAVLFLKRHGAKAINLKDDEAIKKYMAKIGVSFPNCVI